MAKGPSRPRGPSPEGRHKPSSVQGAIYLGRRSPDASCGLPGDDSATGRHSPLIWPCSGWGLPCPGGYPLGRWALTPPFHPYPRHEATGGLFSVALSIGSRRPGVTRHPALRSSDFPRTARPKAPARGPLLPSRLRNITAVLAFGQGRTAMRLDFPVFSAETSRHPASAGGVESATAPGAPTW